MKHNIHYAWINTALCALVLFACGTVSQTYGVFLPEISGDLGYSMTQVSGAITILNAVTAICGPLAARVVNRFGMRRSLPVALSCLAILLTLLTASHSLVGVYLCYALCGCCLYFGLFFLCPYIVNKWFRTRVAETIAMIITAMAIGGAVGNVSLSAIIERFSWRVAYRCEAVFLLVVAILVAVILRDQPEDKHLQPYGQDRAGKDSAAQTNYAGGASLSLRQAMRQPEFYFVVFYVACMQFCVGMQSQIPTIARSIGIAAAIGAVAASINSLGGIPAKALLSVFNVRLGVVSSVALYNLIGTFGILALLFLGNTAGLYLFALMFGFAIGSTTVQLPLLSNHLFGASPDYSGIHARIVLISGLLATPSALIGGRVYDLTGKYDIAMYILIVLLISAIVLAAKAWKHG